MNSHDVTVGGYLAVLLAFLTLQFAATRTKAPVPSLGAILTRIMRTRTGRVGVERFGPRHGHPRRVSSEVRRILSIVLAPTWLSPWSLAHASRGCPTSLPVPRTATLRTRDGAKGSHRGGRRSTAVTSLTIL